MYHDSRHMEQKPAYGRDFLSGSGRFGRFRPARDEARIFFAVLLRVRVSVTEGRRFAKGLESAGGIGRAGQGGDSGTTIRRLRSHGRPIPEPRKAGCQVRGGSRRLPVTETTIE